MPVPTSMNDLSATESSNSPAGSDAISTSLDNYMRAIQAIVRSTNHKGPDIASAASVAIGAAVGEFLTVTGTTGITSFDSVTAGIVRVVQFSGALTITHSTNIQLPGSANYTTTAGDVLTFRSLGSGQWLCVGIANTNLTATIPVLPAQRSFGVVKPSNTSRSSTIVVADDPHLIVSGLAAGSYAVRAVLRASCPANSVNMRYSVSDGALTAGMRIIELTTPMIDEGEVMTSSSENGLALIVSAASTAVLIDAVSTLASTGSIAIKWAQQSSSGNAVTVHANSFMTVTRLD